MKNNRDNIKRDFIEIGKYQRELRSYWRAQRDGGNREAEAELAIVEELFADEEI